jgi:hypothetical protein
MYINFGRPYIYTESLSGNKYTLRHIVQSKNKAHIGSIIFSREANSIGYIEWCEGSLVPGAGIKITIEELLNLIENRKTDTTPQD